MNEKNQIYAFGGLHLAQKVQQIRKQLGESQYVFGKRVGLSQQQISKIERGASVISRQLHRIAEAGNTSMVDLLDDDDAFGPLTETEHRALERFRRLTADNKKEVLGLIDYKLSTQGPYDHDPAVDRENQRFHEQFEEYVKSESNRLAVDIEKES